jgi:hypothetical protein
MRSRVREISLAKKLTGFNDKNNKPICVGDRGYYYGILFQVIPTQLEDTFVLEKWCKAYIVDLNTSSARIFEVNNKAKSRVKPY